MSEALKQADRIEGGLQPVTCPACKGTGEFELPDGTVIDCAEWDCNGTGEVMGWAVVINGVRYTSTTYVNEL